MLSLVLSPTDSVTGWNSAWKEPEIVTKGKLLSVRRK